MRIKQAANTGALTKLELGAVRIVIVSRGVEMTVTKHRRQVRT